MLQQLNEFREKLDGLMLRCMNQRIALIGYGYTGRFLKWYAKYYHNINIDYCVSEELPSGVPFEMDLFQESIFDYQYRDFEKCVFWMAMPNIDKYSSFWEKIDSSRCIDFYSEIYGKDVEWEVPPSDDPYGIKKIGNRDIQFMEYLEWKYGCNFLSMVDNQELVTSGKYGANYRATTQKELFPILDNCHCIPKENDALFDFGCGKGSVLVGALDYGFEKVGGVEYEKGLYEVLIDNKIKLEIPDQALQCICRNAADVDVELDYYNWFYFWSPFNEEIFESCINHLRNSIQRKPRKIRIIYSNPQCAHLFERASCFRLTNQFTIETRKRVVSVWESI